MNGTASFNEIKVERKVPLSSKSSLLRSTRRVLGEDRIVVVILYKLNKRRETSG